MTPLVQQQSFTHGQSQLKGNFTNSFELNEIDQSYNKRPDKLTRDHKANLQ